MDSDQISIQVPQQTNTWNDSILSQSNIQQNNTQQAETISAPKKKRKVSDVWNHYTKLSQGSTTKAICKNCQAALSAQTSSGTNHLWRHFKRCQPNHNSQTRLNLPSSSELTTHHQTNIKNNQHDQLFQKKLLEIVTLNQYPFQIIHDLRFQSLLNSFFKPQSQNIYKSINFEQASINHFESQKNIISQVLRDHHSQLSISIEPWTSQRSTHFIKLSVHYIHHQTWKLIKTTLAFKPILDPLNELELATCICEILQEWHITHKCASITTECSITNDLAINRVKNFINHHNDLLEQNKPKSFQHCHFHINCSNFLINELVKKLLSNNQVIISRLRKIINFLTFTDLKKKIFEQLAETFGLLTTKKLKTNETFDRIQHEENQKNKIDKKIPSMDFPHRWDTTFFMISNSIHFKSVFDHLQIKDPLFPYDPINATDWDQLKNLNLTLKIFYNAICRISNPDSSPASNDLYVNMRRIEIELKKKLTQEEHQEKNDYTKVNNECHILLETLLKIHWNKDNNNNLKELSEICSTFDPRMKLDYLKFALSNNQISLDSSHTIIENLRSRIYTIYKNFYQALILNQSNNAMCVNGSKNGEVEAIPVNPNPNTEESDQRRNQGIKEVEDEANELKEEEIIKDEFENYLSNFNQTNKIEKISSDNDEIEKSCNSIYDNNSWITNELDVYLLEPPLRNININNNNNFNLVHHFDLIDWWKSNQFRFPHLSKFVRLLLAIPVSCVDAELRFYINETNGRELNEFQSSLSDFNFLESLICNKDWITASTI